MANSHRRSGANLDPHDGVGGQVVDTSDAYRRLKLALDDPQWEFRTVDGIAREVGLQPQQIAELLKMHPEIARKSAMTSPDGRELYTERSRRPSARERIERIRWLLAH